MSEPKIPSEIPRLPALDLLRGASVVAMIVVNTQFRDGSGFSQLYHPDHLGLRIADFVMPTFSLLAGAGIPFSVQRALKGKEDAAGKELRAQIFRKELLPRSAKLFMLGYLLGIPYVLTGSGTVGQRLASIRVWGVLQRHAVVFLLAGAGYLCLLSDVSPSKDSEKDKEPIWRRLVRRFGLPTTFTLLWLFVTYYVPFSALPGGKGLFPIERVSDPKRTAAYLIDEALVGRKRLYRGTLDPEGLLGALTGFVNVWAGVLLGDQLLRQRSTAPDPVPILKSGTLLLASSYILTRAPFSIPYSKKLWTPSFALASSGVSLLLIAAVIQLKLPRDPPGPIESVLLDAGRDSLTVYTIQSLLPHALSVLPDPSKPLTESIRAATVSNLFGKGGVEGVAWGLGWAGLCIYLARMAKGREWSIRA